MAVLATEHELNFVETCGDPDRLTHWLTSDLRLTKCRAPILLTLHRGRQNRGMNRITPNTPTSTLPLHETWASPLCIEVELDPVVPNRNPYFFTPTFWHFLLCTFSHQLSGTLYFYYFNQLLNINLHA